MVFLEKDVWVVWAFEALFAAHRRAGPGWLAATALADRALATTVARHRNAFFRERDRVGAYIDYAGAVSGGLRLVPEGDRLTRAHALAR